MSRRHLVIGIVIVLCAGTGWGVFVQHRQLTDLRASYQQLLAGLSDPSDAHPDPATVHEAGAISANPAAAGPSFELLQLRSQVSRLTARKRELPDLSAENDRLKAQLASRGTNTLAGKPLPPDYIRKSQAQWVGMNAPENTVQSFLWALQNRDLTNLIQTLTPKSAAEMMEHAGKSPEEFFQRASVLVGMRISNLRQLPDGSFEAQMEIIPGETMPEKIHFLMIDGQWRLDMP